MENNLAYILNYIFFIVWLLSVVYALSRLRKTTANANVVAIWAAVILFLPFIGVAAFLLVAGRQ